MYTPPWVLHSRPRPYASGVASIVTAPGDGAALLVCDRLHHDPGGRTEVWRWQGDVWTLSHAGLIVDDDGHAAIGTPLAWVDPELGVRIARLCDDGLLTAALADPGHVTRIAAPGMKMHMRHVFALADGRGHMWLLGGGDRETITWRLDGDLGVLVARGPYLVSAAFDPGTATIVGRDVTGKGHRFTGSAWIPDPRLDGRLDTIVLDPRRGAIIGLAVREARMEVVELGAAGWKPAEPPTWLPSYRNQTILGVDRGRDQLLVHSGQDFDRGGAPSGETWYGGAGEMRETADPAMPSWGRYNTLLTLPDGLLAFDHSALRIQRRHGARWQLVARIEPRVPGHFDDRYLNVAARFEYPVILQAEGALVAWVTGSSVVPVAPASARAPGPAYSQRTAIGHDPVRGRVVVGSGDCGQKTHVAEDGTWRVLPDAANFVRGETAVMTSTGHALYALTTKDLRMMNGDEWLVVGPALPGAAGRWLGFDARRGALLAASSDGISLHTAAGWRLLCPLPVAMELGEDGGQLGVDPLADALVLINEARLWSAPLTSLDTSAAVVPTSPMRRSRRAPAKERPGR